MSDPSIQLPDVLRHSPVHVLFGAGTLDRLGEVARQDGASRILLVTDPGIVAAGHVTRAIEILRKDSGDVLLFDGVRENPTTDHVAAGLAVARDDPVDLIIALGGGSAMDCAKGINLLLTNGGEIKAYWGEGKATKPMLPMIAVPTTAGTGSEAQSFALITDPKTGQKMACGDRRLPTDGGLRPRTAILDPDLTLTQSPAVTAATGIDALAHAVESAASTRRTDVSRRFSSEAWQRLEAAFHAVMRDPMDRLARENMLLGAHLAGAAIEHSMLGAAHACANPLTARFNIPHGEAVGIMLPHVVRFNTRDGDNPYSDLCGQAVDLVDRIESLLTAAGLRRTLSECNVTERDCADLATSAQTQWTATFNPRQVDRDDFVDIYRSAL